jgi:uncharacterized repeat protein (TIGR01451 family)
MRKYLPVLLFAFVLSLGAHSQYVQTGPALLDSSAFGVSLQASGVGISSNGQTAVATYPFRQHGNGGFSIYQLNGTQWSEVYRYVAPTGKELGWNPVMSGDGNSVALFTGNHGNSYDSIWVFSKNGNQWECQLRIKFNSSLGYLFYLSQDGGVFAYGPKIYTKNNNNWSLQDSLPGGRITGMSLDGNTLLFNTSTVYQRIGPTWVRQDSLLMAVPGYPGYNSGGNQQGLISGDGKTIVLGGDCFSCPNWGSSIATYKRNNGIWVQDTIVRWSGFNTNGSPAHLSYDGSVLTFYKYFVYSYTAINYGLNSYRYSNRQWVRDSTYTGWNGKGLLYSDSYFRFAIDSSGTKALLSNIFTDSAFGGIKYFTWQNNTWAQAGPVLRDNVSPGRAHQGVSTIMSADGSTLAYSGKQNNYGTVWVYGRNGFKWDAQAVLQSPESDSVPTSFGLTSHNGNYRSFASAIALSGNGSVLAVGSPGNIYYNNPYWGKVFLYKRSNNAWLLDTALYVADSTVYPNKSAFGTSVALSSDGNTLVIGTSLNGTFVFVHSNGAWSLQQQLIISTGAGSDKVALSADGNTLTLSESRSTGPNGSFAIFTRTGTQWQRITCCLSAPGRNTAQGYPSTLAISGNGKYIASADYQISASSSRIHIYDVQNQTWSSGFTYGSQVFAGIGVWLSYTGDTLIQLGIQGTAGLDPVFSPPGANVVDIWVKNNGTWSHSYQLPAAYSQENPTQGGWFNINSYASITADASMKYIAWGYAMNQNEDGGVFIYRRSTLSVNLVSSKSPVCGNNPTGSIKMAISGGVLPVSIQWSTGASGTDSIGGLAAGTYTVTVTDADSVQVVRTYTLTPVSNITFGAAAFSIPCNTSGWATAAVSGGVAPYTYQWSAGTNLTSDTVLITSPGVYVLSVTDAAGCNRSDSIYTYVNNYYASVTAVQPNCTNNGMAGVVFNGATGNVTYNWSSGSTYAVDSLLGPGIHTVTCTDDLGCSATATVQLGNYCGNVINGTVFFDNNNDCVFDSSDAPAPFNIVATNGAYFAYGNTDAAGNYQIVVPTPGTFSVYIYSFGQCGFDMCTGTTYQRQVVFNSTDDTATVTFAVLDTAYDLTINASSPVFNPGFTGNVTLAYTNLKSEDVPNGTVSLVYDASMNFLNSTPPPANVNAATRTITWNVGTIAHGVYGHVYANFNIDSSATVQQVWITTSVQASGIDCNPANNILQLAIPFAASLDPNKKVSRLQDSTITYTIYFQNTGTDSTHFIKIIDTLSPNVNPASLQTLAASNLNYKVTLAGEGVVTWLFDPYFLPDSATNAVTSQGYVTFSVNLVSGLNYGAIIKNTAYIYFDYNPAIVTNTIADTLATPLGIAPVKTSNDITVTLSPNPFNEMTNIAVTGITGSYDFELYDLTGRFQLSIPSNNSNHFRVARGNLAAGVYLYRLKVRNSGVEAYGKIVVQ